jgi:monoamine oxidase
MGQVGQAFARELAPLIRYNAKVVDIHQDEHGVRATYEDTAGGASRQTVQADWCVCTIPLSILGQIPMNVGGPMAAAIAAVPYCTSVKVGLQFKRRFWEEDEQIYGGVSYTDLPIGQISYPSSGFFSGGKGVLLGAYIWDMLNSMEFTSMTAAERVAKAVEYGSNIHPQYREEFDNGIAVAWHRAPFSMGASSSRENTPPTCPPGRKAPSLRRSMPSIDYIDAPSRWEPPHEGAQTISSRCGLAGSRRRIRARVGGRSPRRYAGAG